MPGPVDQAACLRALLLQLLLITCKVCLHCRRLRAQMPGNITRYKSVYSGHLLPFLFNTSVKTAVVVAESATQQQKDMGGHGLQDMITHATVSENFSHVIYR